MSSLNVKLLNEEMQLCDERPVRTQKTSGPSDTLVTTQCDFGQVF